MDDDATNPGSASQSSPEQRRKEKVEAAADRFLKRTTGTGTAGKKTAKKTAPAAKKAVTKKTAAAKKTSAASPAQDAGKEPTAPRAARKTAAAPSPARTAPPAEQEKTTFYSARINLTTTPAQKKMLKLAAVEDGIDTTARIRAMIALYEEDERLRKRIDKLAQHWR
ncbi:hypothetical protein ABZ769_35380 [Streptomyces olivoreticuli]